MSIECLCLVTPKAVGITGRAEMNSNHFKFGRRDFHKTRFEFILRYRLSAGKLGRDID